MIENLKRVREPAGWVVLAVIVATMALNLVRLAWMLTRGDVPVFAAFAEVANNMMSPTLVAVAVALVCVSLFLAPATPNAGLLARWSALIVTLGTLLTAVSLLLGLWASTGLASALFELLGGVLDIVLKVLGVAILWVIDRAVRAGRLRRPAGGEPEAELAVPSVGAAPPVWQAGQAAGAVWRTAADAAAGTPAAARAIASEPDAAPASSAATGAAEQAPPDAPYTAASAWAANPETRPGAAEALGWRRLPGASGESTSKP